MFEIDLPSGMRSYLRNYGYHFSKKANEEACRKLRKHNPATGKMEAIEPYTKDQVDELLTRHNIKLEQNVGYDYVYVANLAKATLYKSSIPDEKTLAQHIKDVVDNPLLPCGNIFRRWLVDCDFRGIGVEWDDIL
ncbi:MAG: hypothetical protein NC311_09895 [Muribaculaceae bacterium]|nr:hypothetical protein [Muribaculaceae bacterium]